MSQHKPLFGLPVRERIGRQRGWWPRRNGTVLKTTYNEDALVQWPDGTQYWYFVSDLKRMK